jgi:hypothetical protein
VLALVITLTLAGGVLPVLAITRAVVTAHRRYKDLDADLRRIDAVMHSGGSFEEMEAVRPSRLRAGTIAWAPDVAERTFFHELRRPAILGAVGVLAGMAGSLLSLTL